MGLFRSCDDGLTWTFEDSVTLSHQFPGHLLQLADGALLLVFEMRNQNLRGVETRLSVDRGRTWGNLRVLAEYDPQADGGCPASAQIKGECLPGMPPTSSAALDIESGVYMAYRLTYQVRRSKLPVARFHS